MPLHPPRVVDSSLTYTIALVEMELLGQLVDVVAFYDMVGGRTRRWHLRLSSSSIHQTFWCF